MDGRLRDVLAGDEVPPNLFVVSGDRVLVVNRREVRDGRGLGAVISLHGVRRGVPTPSRSTRCGRCSTRCARGARRQPPAHAVRAAPARSPRGGGRLHPGARRGPDGQGGPPGTYPTPISGRSSPPSPPSRREKGVELDIAPTTWVPGRVSAPLDVTTVLGNLVENALEAAASAAGGPPASRSASATAPTCT